MSDVEPEEWETPDPTELIDFEDEPEVHDPGEGWFEEWDEAA